MAGFLLLTGCFRRTMSSPFSIDSLKTLLEEKEDFFEDEDVVRLCLLYSFFIGVETTKLVEQDHLLLVDNLQFWNECNWGSFLWSRTYPSLLNIWIYECFPYMKTICTYNESIPRAIGWEKLRRSHWTYAQMIFGKFYEVTTPFIICYLSTNDLFMNY
ncbi:hypothetical protein R6Q57_026548 [Mikania cordata]